MDKLSKSTAQKILSYVESIEYYVHLKSTAEAHLSYVDDKDPESEAVKRLWNRTLSNANKNIDIVGPAFLEFIRGMEE